MEQIEHHKMACKGLIQNLWRFGPQTLPNLISTLIIGTVVAKKKKPGTDLKFSNIYELQNSRTCRDFGPIFVGWPGAKPTKSWYPLGHPRVGFSPMESTSSRSRPCRGTQRFISKAVWDIQIWKLVLFSLFFLVITMF